MLLSFIIISCGSDDKENIYSKYNGMYEITYSDLSGHSEGFFKLEAGDFYSDDGLLDHLGLTFCNSSDESSCDEGFFSNYSIFEDHYGIKQISGGSGTCYMSATSGSIKEDGDNGDVILTYENKTATFTSLKCDFDTMDKNMDKLVLESTDIVKGSLVK
jgi:hypothetical protein